MEEHWPTPRTLQATARPSSPSTSGHGASCAASSPTGSGLRVRKVALALLFTAGLAATTGGYPLIIKHSFDSLMKPDSGVLPLVLTAVIVRHCLARPLPVSAPGDHHAHRAAHGHRHSEGGVRTSGECGLCTYHARDHGPAGVAADQRSFLHPAGGANLARRVHQGRAVCRRGVLRDALSGLADDAGHSRLVPDCDPAGAQRRAAGCGRYRGERR